jgi:methionyl-tRNA synthetase
VNKYMNETEPWKEKDEKRVHTILYSVVSSLRIISGVLSSFMPETSENIRRQFSLKEEEFEQLTFDTLKSGGSVGKADILFQKVEQTVEEDPLAHVRLKVAKILEAAEHPEADKLFVLQIDIGKKKQLVAGLRGHYTAEELVGKHIVIVDNLKYAKLRGIESQGMLLAGEDKKNVGLVVPEHSKPGDDVYVEGIAYDETKQITVDQFFKAPLTVKDGKAYYGEKLLQTAEEDFLKVDKVEKGKIK